jgi:hypothetical protein
MNNKCFTSISTLTVLTIALSGIFSGSEKISTAQSQPILSESYLKALEDAALPESHEVLNNLTVIDQSNPNLTWDEQGRVLMVNFTKENRFQPAKPIQSNDNSSPTVIWVTVAPQLKDFCTNYLKANPELNTQKRKERLEQLLGLKPNSSNTHIAEIWVHPKYLKRPSIDPEIDDPIAQIPPPYHEVCPDNNGNNCNSYQKWLKERLKEQEANREYFSNNSGNLPPNLYPWTGLGYTFDWGIYPKTPLQTDAGLSEFIIFLEPNLEPSFNIEVKTVMPTEQYCNFQNQTD